MLGAVARRATGERGYKICPSDDADDFIVLKDGNGIGITVGHHR